MILFILELDHKSENQCVYECTKWGEQHPIKGKRKGERQQRQEERREGVEKGKKYRGGRDGIRYVSTLD